MALELTQVADGPFPNAIMPAKGIDTFSNVLCITQAGSLAVTGVTVECDKGDCGKERPSTRLVCQLMEVWFLADKHTRTRTQQHNEESWSASARLEHFTILDSQA